MRLTYIKRSAADQEAHDLEKRLHGEYVPQNAVHGALPESVYKIGSNQDKISSCCDAVTNSRAPHSVVVAP